MRQHVSHPDRRAIRGVEQQIGTIAALHELLAHGGEEGRIDLSRYLDQITELLKGIVPKAIHVTGQFEDVWSMPIRLSHRPTNPDYSLDGAFRVGERGLTY